MLKSLIQNIISISDIFCLSYSLDVNQIIVYPNGILDMKERLL